MRKKGIVSVICVLMTMVMLSGCSLLGGDFDAAGYVQGTLDAAYKGETAQYVELTNATEAEALAEYEEVIDYIWESLITGLTLTDAEEADARDMCIKYMTNVKYSVADAKKESSSKFTVDVTVEPLVSFYEDGGVFAEFEEDYTTRAEDGEFEDMDMDDFVAQMSSDAIKLFGEYVNSPEYQEPVTVTLNVVRDSSENAFVIEDAGFAELTELMILQ